MLPEPSRRPQRMSRFTSFSSVGSPATMTNAAALRALMTGTMLGEALGSVRQGQWEAVSRCYARAGVDAHLGALILMLLGTRTMNCDRSFAHGLRTACPRTALALPGFRRPAVRRRRPSVMLERFLEKLVTLGNLAKLRSTIPAPRRDSGIGYKCRSMILYSGA